MTEETTRARNEASDQPRRRRSESEDTNEFSKMTIPEGVKDEKQFRYRWANDDGPRIHQLIQKDWDVVSIKGEVGKLDDDKSVRHRVGNKSDGSPLYAYLMRQPLKFADEDKAKKVEKIAREESALLRDAPAGEKPDQSYKPKVA